MTHPHKLLPILLALAAFACTGARDATTANPLPAKSPSADSAAIAAATAQRVDSVTLSPVVPSVAATTSQTPEATPAVAAPPLSSRGHPTSPVLDSLIRGTLPARGLYVFRYAVNNRRLKHLIGISDSTEINALVLDVKDEFGLNFAPSDPLLKKNAGSQANLRNMKELVDTIRAHGILPIARIVVFKDRSEEHTSELQSLAYLVCRLLLEKKKFKMNP